MKRFFSTYLTACGFALIEHVRNRLAIALVVGFIPMWLFLVDRVIGSDPIPFLLHASDEMLQVNGKQMLQITGALNAVVLIVGFMMFAATYSSGMFDLRLALAGYPRPSLVLAKITAMVFAAVLISGYAAAIVELYWTPHRTWLLALGLFTAALTYGALGVLLAALMRSELAGMFLIIMISFVDVCLQTPMGNHSADGNFLQYLPSYGSLQSVSAAGFSDVLPWSHLALEFGWFVGVTVVTLVIFQQRTRNRQAALAV